MSTEITVPSTAQRLRKLPPHERDAILAAAAEAAEAEYRHNPELTSFEAFDKDDTPSVDELCDGAP